MPICPACAGEAPSMKDRQRTGDCKECYVETSEYFKEDQKSMERNCSCYAAGHPNDKKELEKFMPLKELKEYDKMIKKEELERLESAAKLKANQEKYEAAKLKENQD